MPLKRLDSLDPKKSAKSRFCFCLQNKHQHETHTDQVWANSGFTAHMWHESFSHGIFMSLNTDTVNWASPSKSNTINYLNCKSFRSIAARFVCGSNMPLLCMEQEIDCPKFKLRAKSHFAMQFYPYKYRMNWNIPTE